MPMDKELKTNLIKWGRRVAVITIFGLLCKLPWAFLPSLLPLIIIWDYKTDNGFFYTRVFSFLSFYLTVESIVSSLLCGLLLLKFYAYIFDNTSFMEKVYFWSWKVQRLYATVVFKGAETIFQWKPCQLEGFEKFGNNEKPVLLLLRHTSMIDTFFCERYLPGTHKLRYIVKKTLLYLPFFNLIEDLAFHVAIDREARSKGQGTEQLERMVSTISQNVENQTAIVLYPEGTRCTEKKRAAIIRKLHDEGKPELYDSAKELKYLLPPKLGGVMSVLKACPQLDVAIIGHTGFYRLLKEKRRDEVDDSLECPLAAKAWYFSRDDVPADDAAFKSWLLTHWKEMDTWVGAQYALNRWKNEDDDLIDLDDLDTPTPSAPPSEEEKKDQ